MHKADHDDPVVIVGSARTPLGAFLGSLQSLSAPELGAVAIKAALERAKLKPEAVDEVIMGCVVSAGVGQAPARQATLLAGLPDSVSALTVNKVCGSGMKAIMLACDMLSCDSANVIVAGGMESMSNAPYLLDRARTGHRLGHAQVKDAMMLDGLEDAYEKGLAMGVFADRTAEDYKFSRAMQDEFALTSLNRAQESIKNKWFNSEYEITATQVKSPKGEVSTVEVDEPPLNAKPEKIPNLKPVFNPNGTVTAANASSIADGAAAIVLMRKSEAEKQGLKPIAKIIGHSTHSHKPALFTTAPVKAIQNLLKKVGWKQDSVDLFEINEAFACVTMAAIHDLELDHARVNVHGGACALGHPIGASGARIVCTLLGALKRNNKKRGVAALCIGGGEATAVAIEML